MRRIVVSDTWRASNKTSYKSIAAFKDNVEICITTIIKILSRLCLRRCPKKDLTYVMLPEKMSQKRQLTKYCLRKCLAITSDKHRLAMEECTVNNPRQVETKYILSENFSHKITIHKHLRLQNLSKSKPN